MTEARHKRPHIIRLHLYETSTTGRSVETESGRVVATCFGEDGMESDCLMDMGFLFGLKMWNYTVVTVIQLCAYTEHTIVHFKIEFYGM